MKTLTVLCLLCAAAYGYPAGSDEASSESELILPLMRKGMPSVVEVDVGDSDEDSFFFPSLFRPFFANPFPQFKFGGFSSLFPSSFFGLHNFFNRVPEDAKVTNSTSTVKVVDGHKITVNATTYENEKNGAVYKYEVIEVTRLDNNPEEGSDKTDTDESATKNVQASEETSTAKNDNDSLDNEIFREEFTDGYWAKEREFRPITRYNQFDKLNQDYIDLSDDIRVNALAEQSGNFIIPADVEVFHVGGLGNHASNIHDYYTAPQLVYPYSYNTPQTVHPFGRFIYDKNQYKNRLSNQYHFNNIQYRNIPTRNLLQSRSPQQFNYQGRFAYP